MRLGRWTALLSVCIVMMSGSALGVEHSECTKTGTRAAIVSFMSAFNRGDYERLDSLFASSPDFRWYSSNRPGRRLNRRAKQRDTLIGYFRNRHAKQDRLNLLSFGFNGNAPRWGNFELTARRSSADFRGGRWFEVHGKGAAVCDEDSVQLIVLAFGGPVPTVPST